MSPRLTVAICTHNRYATLGNSVRALLESRGFAQADCELLVVDNTPPAMRRALPVPERPDARVTFCDAQGLSHARNHAVRHSHGEVITFLDDDALVCDDWCDHILSRMTGGGDLLAVGGKVAPQYDGDAMPAWYDDSLAGHLSCIDWSPTPRFLRAGGVGGGRQPHAPAQRVRDLRPVRHRPRPPRRRLAAEQRGKRAARPRRPAPGVLRPRHRRAPRDPDRAADHALVPPTGLLAGGFRLGGGHGRCGRPHALGGVRRHRGAAGGASPQPQRAAHRTRRRGGVQAPTPRHLSRGGRVRGGGGPA